MNRVILLVLICIGYAFNMQAQSGKDTTLLFLDKEKALAEDTTKSLRMVGKRYLQISNYAGKTISLKMSLDRKNWADVVLKSRQKRIFRCPKKSNKMYVIVDPKAKRPMKQRIGTKGRYEIFYNKNLKLYDIMGVSSKKGQ